MNTIRKPSRPAQLTVAGLVLTAAGMLLQIVAGSVLYPSFAGPIVLLASAVVVAFVPVDGVGWSPRSPGSGIGSDRRRAHDRCVHRAIDEFR
jgi:hypothetical protein